MAWSTIFELSDLDWSLRFLQPEQNFFHHQVPILWQYTPGRYPLSQPRKLLMAIRSSSGFSHLRPRVFNISIRTHKAQNTQPRGLKKREQTRTWVSSKRKKGEVCDIFVQLSVHLHAITSVYSSEIPTKSPGMQTHLLTFANLASVSTGLAPALFCWLSCSVEFSVLPPSFDSGTFLPASSFGLVGNLSCRHFVWVSR